MMHKHSSVCSKPSISSCVSIYVPNLKRCFVQQTCLCVQVFLYVFVVFVVVVESTIKKQHSRNWKCHERDNRTNNEMSTVKIKQKKARNIYTQCEHRENFFRLQMWIFLQFPHMDVRMSLCDVYAYIYMSPCQYHIIF